MALKSHGLVSSCENWKEYSIPQCLSATDLAGCLYTMSSNPWCHMSLELCVLIRSLGILSMLLFSYIYMSFLYLLLSIPTMWVGTKYCKKVTYVDRLLPIKSHDHLNNWSCQVKWQNKN